MHSPNNINSRIRAFGAKAICAALVVLGQLSSTAAPTDSKRRLSCERPLFELVRNGFASSSCRNVLQDKDGYIWIGTDNGVARYDGLHVECFGAVEAQARLRGRRIISMAEDSLRHCIWASIDRSASLLSIDTKTLETTILDYKTPDGEEAGTYSAALSLASINDSMLICRMARAFYAVNKNTGAVRLIKEYKGLVNSANTPFFSFLGATYNVGGGALNKITTNAKGEVSVTEADLGGLTGIKDVAVKDDTTLIVMSMTQPRTFGTFFYHSRTGVSELIGTSPDTPHGMASADDGLWVATNHGLHFLRYDDKSRHIFTPANSTLQDNAPTSILKARDQHIFFIGTADGLVTLSYFNSKFQRTDMLRYSTSANPQVWSIVKDSRNCYWIGCLDGLYKRRDNSLFYENVDIDEISGSVVLSLWETPEHDGLIVSTPKDVYKIDYDGRLKRHITHNDDMIRSAQPIGNGEVIVTSRSSVSIVSASNGKSRKTLTAPEWCRFKLARTDDYKTLWVVNYKQEIDGYDINTLERKYIIVLQGDSVGSILDIRHNVANGMNELWIATTSGGLLYKNPGYAGIMPFNDSQLLQSDIHSLELDSLGGLWVSTDLGIAHVDAGNVTEYQTDRFGLCNKFLTRSSARGTDGNILMGGRNDFVEFSPHDFIENDYFPTPMVTSYQYFNFSVKTPQEWTTPHIYRDGPIEIPAGVRDVIINARCLSYDHPEKTNVEWMADDEHEWKKSMPNGNIYLTSLSEGVHTIYMRSTNDAGKPQAGVRSLKVTKHVLFYETRLFVWLIVTLIASTVVAMWIWKNYQYRKIRNKLTRDVNSISDMLLAANKELRKRQAEVKKRNEEISAINSNLQSLVEQQTKDLMEAKAKAEESSQLKSDFLASLGHEVRTPMNAIVGFAKLLKMDECPKEERIEFASLILKSANSLLGMLGALLDSSRIERGILQVSKSDTNVYQEIIDTYHMLSVEKKNPNVKFILDVSDNLKDVVLYTDKERLRQIIINITYNAFKFTTDGHVKISAWKEKASELTKLGLLRYPQELSFTSDVLLMSIDDTGIGIPENKREIIFEPFRRLTDNAVKHPGLGLGLNIVKNLVILLGGEVWLKSEVGRGSTFYFYLPFEQSEEKR